MERNGWYERPGGKAMNVLKGLARGSAMVTCVWVWGALGGAACGDSDNANDVGQSDGEVAPDAAEEVDTTDVADSADVEVDEPREPSGFRGPCRSNNECISGWCVPTSEGTVCTEGCSTGCPEGWSCGRVLNTSIDQIELCLDRATTLCHPCEANADCNLFQSTRPNVCIGAGDAGGGFCGLSCSATEGCPADFFCANQSGEPTDGDGQCRPTAGACTCNGLAVALSLETGCFVENEVGTCTGSRQCGSEGLSVCSARTAVAEACNGVDDDCDGRTDEELAGGAACDITNAFGTCPGQRFCVEGAERCLGVAPVAEICDGLDQNCNGGIDEGFPDLDGDGVANCVDPDIDGDGTLNGDDCAPLDAARSRTANEVCNGVDDDCDGTADNEGADGCEVWFQDVDGDGFGSQVAPGRCFCSAQPAIFYVVKNTDDCADLDETRNPNGVEVCNGADDNCGGGTDEGVQAPCGGCVPLCLLPSGPGTANVFNPSGANASNVSLNGSGQLRLTSGQTSGYYRQRWDGWPTSGTEWSTLFADVELPTGTTVSFRWRSATSLGGLDGAAFSSVVGPYPPASLPIFFVVTGRAFEVEVQLTSTSGSVTPLVKKLEVLAKSL
jgi:hypothetical protein